MIKLRKITEEEAITILNKEEDHFFDITRREYSGEAVQKKCVAFANADGGDLLIGIHDKKEKNLPGGKFERWNGFASQEDANNALFDIAGNIQPSLPDVSFEFLEIEKNENLGKVLKATIEKSSDVHYVAGGNSYVRKGAQCLKISGSYIIDLQLSKGASTYENQKIASYDINRLLESEELKKFLDDYLPKTDPKEFLLKQNLIIREQTGDLSALCAGILLYDENPSVVLTKKMFLKSHSI